MIIALVVFGMDAVLAWVLWWMNRSGWIRDDQRVYRRMKEK